MSFFPSVRTDRNVRAFSSILAVGDNNSPLKVTLSVMFSSFDTYMSYLSYFEFLLSLLSFMSFVHFSTSSFLLSFIFSTTYICDDCLEDIILLLYS